MARSGRSDTSHRSRSSARLQMGGIALALLVLGPPKLHAQSSICFDAPCGLNLVGTSDTGVPDPHGKFTIKLGVGPTCVPLANTSVQLDFLQCQPDIKLCQFQSAGSVSCANPGAIYFGQTDANGELTISLVGGANNTTGAAPGYSGAPCVSGCMVVRLAVFGVAGLMSVGTYDENSSGGVNPVDISVWLTDSFSSNYYARSDFDFSGLVRPPDLSLLLSVSLAGQSRRSCSLYCL